MLISTAILSDMSRRVARILLRMEISDEISDDDTAFIMSVALNTLQDEETGEVFMEFMMLYRRSIIKRWLAWLEIVKNFNSSQTISTKVNVANLIKRITDENSG